MKETVAHRNGTKASCPLTPKGSGNDAQHTAQQLVKRFTKLGFDLAHTKNRLKEIFEREPSQTQHGTGCGRNRPLADAWGYLAAPKVTG